MIPPAQKPSKVVTEVIIGVETKMSEMSDLALAALVKSGKAQKDPFEHGNIIVRLRFNRDDGNPQLEPVTPTILRGELDRIMTFVDTTLRKPKVIPPPMHVVQDVLAQPGWGAYLPGLRRLIKSPYVGPDWQIVTSPGDDAASEIYLP